MSWEIYNNEEIFKQFDDYTRNQVVRFDDVKEAEEAVITLAPEVEVIEFRQQNFSLYQRYVRLFNLCRLVAASSLSEQDLIKFLNQGIGVFFEVDDIDLKKKMNAYLLAMRIYDERDAFKEKMRNALKNNKELLGEPGIKLKMGNNQIEPTLQNWLRDYDITVGLDRPDPLKRAEYFTTGENFRKLKEPLKTRVRLFLAWYDRLKLSSQTPEGTEDIVGFDLDGKQAILKDGQFEEVDPRLLQEAKELREYFEKNGMWKDGYIINPPGWHKDEAGEWVEENPVDAQAVKQTAKPEYAANVVQTVSASTLSPQPTAAEQKTPTATIDPDESRRIEAVLATMRMMPGDPVPAMLKALHDKKLIDVQGYLRYFALSGDLPDLMVHPEIMKLFKPYLERKLGQAAALAYTSKPKRPQYVKLFLQWVLQEELGLSPEAAAARLDPIIKILAVDDTEFS